MKVGDKVTLFSAVRGPFNTGIVTDLSDDGRTAVHLDSVDGYAYFSSSNNRSLAWRRDCKHANYIRPYTASDDFYVSTLPKLRGMLEALAETMHNLPEEELAAINDSVSHALEVVNGRMGK